MIRINEIKQSLDSNKEDLYSACARALKIKNEQIKALTITRQSVDSRKKDNVFFCYTVDVEVDGDEEKIIKKLNSNKLQLVEPYKYEMPEVMRKSKYRPHPAGYRRTAAAGCRRIA